MMTSNDKRGKETPTLNKLDLSNIKAFDQPEFGSPYRVPYDKMIIEQARLESRRMIKVGHPRGNSETNNSSMYDEN